MSGLYLNLDDFTTAWLSLDADDNDFVHFPTHLTATLQRAAPGSNTTTQKLMASLTNPGEEVGRLMGVLSNDVLRADADPLLLALDDLHVIQDPKPLEALDYLIGHLPENLHLVMATRVDPPLSLPRLRARGHLAEFRVANLRFSPEEFRAFLERQLGYGLPPDSITGLQARTEGWAAVLRLLTASLERIPTPSEREAFVERFLQADRYVFGFLLLLGFIYAVRVANTLGERS